MPALRRLTLSRLCIRLLACPIAGAGAGAADAELPGDHAAQMEASAELFRTQVGPLFRKHCLDCHGGEETKSGFSLAQRAGVLQGGDQGQALVPHRPQDSALLAYLRHEDEPHMPPKKPPLSTAAIESIARWIKLGAAYDKPLLSADAQKDADSSPLAMEVDADDRDYWAYRPLQPVALPRLAADRERSLHGPIDRFIAAAHEARGLTPAPPLDRAKLARRLWFDLIGLPPSPEDVRSFVQDDSPDALERRVDALLASQHFGERWARPWLDIARFAESHGFEHDSDRPHAYHYRDFVIRAFNADMPYDQFVQWQIAGDELAPDQALAKMATGFLGAGVYPTQITISDAERVRYDALDDMVATMGSALLATTIGCARCHDHKYDPVPTRDYYALLSAFGTTVRTEVEMDLSGLALGLKEKVMICSEGPDIKPMRLHTSSGSIPDFYAQTYFLNRGDVNQKGEVASLGFLQVLTADGCETEKWRRQAAGDSRTSRRRAAIAHWLTDTAEGAGALLARVVVNRLWQHHFGRGLVATPNDFGFQGEMPSHPDLLEWLAKALVDNGWRLKPLHRMIVMSRAYQMGSSTSSEQTALDPENRLLWHRPARRLEAEAIRDTALAVSGALDRALYGPGTLDPHMKRRSIYFQVKRSQLVPMMQLFDWPDTLTSLGARATTTTPSQALVFINSPEIRELAETFATGLAQTENPVTTAYWTAFSRSPGTEEAAHAHAFLTAQTQAHGGDRRTALADFCQALFGMNEFIYIE